MAILFKLSPKKQKISFWVAITLLFISLLIISLFVFPPKLRNDTLINEVFRNSVNFGIMDSEEVKNLAPFSDSVKTEFNFTAQDKNQKQVTGRISALSKDDAKKELEEKGLIIFNLQEANIGKSDPFLPYYIESQNASQ